MNSTGVSSLLGQRVAYALSVLILFAIPLPAQVNSNAALNASKGNVVVSHAASLNLAPTMTVEAWVKPSAPASPFGAVVDKDYASGFAFGVSSLGGGRTDSVDVLFKVPGYSFTGPRIASDSLTWVHLALTVDTVAHQANFYKSGAQASNASGPTVRFVNNTADLRIGRSYSGDQYRGMCDEVRIWNAVRSAADIAALWNQEAKGNEPGLIAVYHFEDPRDTVAWNRAASGGLHGTFSASGLVVQQDRPDAFVDENEPNNAFAAATPVNDGSVLQTASIAPADTDFFKIWSWPGDELVVRTSAKTASDTCNLRVSFYGPDTVFHITTYVTNFPSFYTAASVPGYHYIRVINNSGAGGSYVLRTYRNGIVFTPDKYEPNNTRAQATPWDWGTTGYGTIFPGLDAGVAAPDTDFYSVTAQKDEIGFFVYAYQDYPCGSGFCTMHDATTQLSKTFNTYYQNYRFPAAGTYYVRIHPNEATHKYYWGAFKGLADVHEMLYEPAMVGDGAQLCNGMKEVYSRAYLLKVDNTNFKGSPDYALTDLDGRQFLFGPQTLSGLSVMRKFFVPSAAQGDTVGFMRIQDILTNPTAAPITVKLGVLTSLLGTTLRISASSSGDTLFTTDDRWLCTDDNYPSSGKPALTHIIDGVGGADRVDSATLAGTNLYWEWRNVTVAPGDTKIYLYFVSQDSLQATALKKGPAFSGSVLPATAKLGLGSDALRVMNWPTDALVSAEANETVPLTFALEQNYPNPFNPTTTVSWQLPVASTMRLVVYDLLGREVAVLVNETKKAGKHTVTFDGSRLASGIYFCRMQARPLDFPLLDSAQKRDSESGTAIGRDSKSGAGNFVQTRKLLLLK